MKNKKQGSRINLLDTFVVRRPFFDYSQNGLHLDEILENEDFQEAVFYASPKLYQEMLKYKRGILPKKEVVKMEKTLYKYYSRMSYRCTPFGLFAQCGCGHYASHINLTPENVYKRYSLPFETIDYYQRTYLQTCPDEVLKTVTVLSNQTIVKRGRRNQTISYFLRTSNGEVKKASLPLTQILRSVIRHTHRPIKIEELAQKLLSEYEIPSDSLLKYIRDLISNTVLLSDYDITLEPGFRFSTIATALKKKALSDDDSFAKNLIGLNSLVETLADTNSQLETISSFLEEKGKDSKLSKVNVNSYSTGFTLPDSLKATIEELFSLFWDLEAAMRDTSSAYRKKILDRYEMQEIPLLEVLDEDTGLGNPSILYPDSQFLMAAQRDMRRQQFGNSFTAQLSPFEQLILKKLNETHDFATPIKLTRDDFRPFTRNLSLQNMHRQSLPLSFSCMFKIVGRNGDSPILSEVQFSGQSAASMLTRFCHENPEIKEMTENIMLMESEHYPDNILLAEVAHTTKPSLAYLQLRPLARPYIMPYISYVDKGEKGILDLSDLVVAIRDNHIVLRSKKLGKEVLPCFTTAYNPYFNSTPLYKFMYELHHQFRVNSLTINTMGLNRLFPHLPRVEYDNVILSPESWYADTDAFKEKGKYTVESFKSWGEKVGLSRYSRFSRKDNFLVVDMTSDLSIRIFLDEIKNDKNVYLSEFLPMAADMLHYQTIAEVIQPIMIKS